MVASGPTTAVESEYTNVNVATAKCGHPGRQQQRGAFTPERLSRPNTTEAPDTRIDLARDV